MKKQTNTIIHAPDPARIQFHAESDKNTAESVKNRVSVFVDDSVSL